MASTVEFSVLKISPSGEILDYAGHYDTLAAAKSAIPTDGWSRRGWDDLHDESFVAVVIERRAYNDRVSRVWGHRTVHVEGDMDALGQGGWLDGLSDAALRRMIGGGA